MRLLSFPSEIGIQTVLRDLLDPRFLQEAGNILAGFCTVQDFAERLARLLRFIRALNPTYTSDFMRKIPAIIDRLLDSDNPDREAAKSAFEELVCN
ncbi:MAG: hypothetical protein KBD00_01160 [Candidatus Peribacteraceae bacterium]|nr:hypothetical protein [Candidatus Peribacteraceae bacterium]